MKNNRIGREGPHYGQIMHTCCGGDGGGQPCSTETATTISISSRRLVVVCYLTCIWGSVALKHTDTTKPWTLWAMGPCEYYMAMARTKLLLSSVFSCSNPRACRRHQHHSSTVILHFIFFWEMRARESCKPRRDEITGRTQNNNKYTLNVNSATSAWLCVFVCVCVLTYTCTCIRGRVGLLNFHFYLNWTSIKSHEHIQHTHRHTHITAVNEACTRCESFADECAATTTNRKRGINNNNNNNEMWKWRKTCIAFGCTERQIDFNWYSSVCLFSFFDVAR